MLAAAMAVSLIRVKSPSFPLRFEQQSELVFSEQLSPLRRGTDCESSLHGPAEIEKTSP